MEYLINTLSWIAAALQVPVVVAMLYLLTRGLLALGVFYGHWTDRMRLRARVGDLSNAGADALTARIGDPAETARRRPDALQAAVAQLSASPGDAAWHERVITEFELANDRRLALYRTMARIGPLLGLMGTLIPLGPALVGLAAGDIGLLARKMEVAFATTVVGLVVGAIGFLLFQPAQRWAVDDLSLLELLSTRLRSGSAEATAARLGTGAADSPLRETGR